MKNENSRLSKTTGVPLNEWQDDAVAEPAAIVVAVHGFAQDANALSSIAETLAGQGYLVVAPDLRGHGRWKESDASMEEDLLTSGDDVARILALLHKRHKKANVYCLAESTGSGVVMNALAKQSKGVRGIILCAAGSQPRFHNPAVMGSKFIKGMATFVSQVDITSYLQHYLSDDPRVATEMINDPLAKKSQSAVQLLGTMNFIKDMPLRAAKLPASIPVLVLQGAGDQIVLPESAEPVFQAVKARDKEFVPVPGSGHILVGTSFIKSPVLNKIENWLAKHGGAAALGGISSK
ncbi:MAG: alpha/beta fold hydrolase [Candidatus Melainabacteria bacterium]|nr:alpha/beta fold hydrolase [Candidatus Melainabacteria bacterium]